MAHIRHGGSRSGDTGSGTSNSRGLRHSGRAELAHMALEGRLISRLATRPESAIRR
jgi:hypothetical protein